MGILLPKAIQSLIEKDNIDICFIGIYFIIGDLLPLQDVL
jgi:hypothetical protein